MSENVIFAIVVVFTLLVVFIYFHFFKSLNSEMREELSNLAKKLSNEIQWNAIKKTSVVGRLQGYKIEISLVPVEVTYCGYHITLEGNFEKQPIFMLSYPKFEGNIEQRGNTLFSSVSSYSVENNKTLYQQVKETINKMLLLASKLEKRS